METGLSNNIPERILKFRDGIRTDKGLRRSENQDNYGFAHTDRVSMYLVCDGMGGARGGKVASAIAVNSILRSAFDATGGVTVDSLRQAFEQTNTKIFKLSREEKSLEGMGTTAVLLVLVGDRAIAAHVGDSRMYLVRDGKISRTTRDHTIVQDLIDSGAITLDDAGKHPLAHMLTRSLGPAESVEAEIRELDGPVRPGDKFLVCCDGLYNHVSDPEIEEVLSNNEPDKAAEILLQKALAGGGLDNITVEVVEPLPVSDSAETIDYPAFGKVRIVVSNADPTTEDDRSPVSTLSLSVESLQGFDPAKLPERDDEMSRTGYFRADQVVELAARQRAEAEAQQQFNHPSMDSLLRVQARPLGLDGSEPVRYNDDPEEDLIGELNLLRIAAILVVVFAIVSVVVVLYRHDVPRVVSNFGSLFSNEAEENDPLLNPSSDDVGENRNEDLKSRASEAAEVVARNDASAESESARVDLDAAESRPEEPAAPSDQQLASDSFDSDRNSQLSSDEDSKKKVLS